MKHKPSGDQEMKPHEMKSHTNHYARLVLMLLASFAAMYVLMYAMVDVVGNAIPNVNQFYMAGLMTAPMLIIELILMWSMYPNKTVNKILLAAGLVALGLFWWGIRSQAAVGDNQFLRSMIPHHAGALLMCKQADLRDPDLRSLCKKIIAGQQSEIDFMRKKLGR